MKRTQLSSEFYYPGRGETPRFDDPVRCKALLQLSGGGMNCFSGKRLLRVLSASVSVLALIIWLSGSVDNALAAEDPAAKSSAQVDSLEIPGSFKDLPIARDAVTAKGSAAAVESVPQTGSIPASALVIDAEKVARISSAAVVDSSLLDFHATAYCLKGRTASGIHTRPGVIAADPSVLPLGTVVHLRAGRYTGTYTVMDTGGRIKGRLVDVYVPTYREAVEFGRRPVKIKVIGRHSTKQASKALLAAEL
jgi:3D (Asp-Asp-Asp) domain-containing protein